ncbi:AAA family ATPase, partial [Leucothrix pacifica]
GLVGVRQSGKTTTLAQLDNNWKVYDLENASDYEVVARDPDLFLRLNSGFVALD